MSAILPGNRIGLMGSGQLGRMFAQAAKAMGYAVRVYSPEKDAPANSVCDEVMIGAYDDGEALKRFGEGVSVITYEFENIPVASVELIEKLVPVRPGSKVLHVSQNRIREKSFVKNLGFEVPRFYEVRSREDLEQGIKEIGYPAILKTAGFGYDGKGQKKLHGPQDLEACRAVGITEECILESFVSFEKEISLIAARNQQGEIMVYDPFENSHVNHILDITLYPAAVPAASRETATQIMRTLVEALDVVGLLCVEFFVQSDGAVIVNEIAPRPHNSGHITMNASRTSQFEQQVRAICNLPLGDTSPISEGGMLNLLGDVWPQLNQNQKDRSAQEPRSLEPQCQEPPSQEPPWSRLQEIPDLHLHLYGKTEPRSRRKMGHLNVLRASRSEIVSALHQAREILK